MYIILMKLAKHFSEITTVNGEVDLSYMVLRLQLLSIAGSFCLACRNNVLDVEVYFESFQYEELRTEPSYTVSPSPTCVLLTLDK